MLKLEEVSTYFFEGVWEYSAGPFGSRMLHSGKNYTANSCVLPKADREWAPDRFCVVLNFHSDILWAISFLCKMGLNCLSGTLRSSAERLCVSTVVPLSAEWWLQRGRSNSWVLRIWCLQGWHSVPRNCVSVPSGGSLQLVNASSSISTDESRGSLRLAGTIEKWHCLPRHPSITGHKAALLLALQMGWWSSIGTMGSILSTLLF